MLVETRYSQDYVETRSPEELAGIRQLIDGGPISDEGIIELRRQGERRSYGLGQRPLDMSEMHVAIQELAAARAISSAADIIAEKQAVDEAPTLRQCLCASSQPGNHLSSPQGLSLSEVMALKAASGIKYPGQ